MFIRRRQTCTSSGFQAVFTAESASPGVVTRLATSSAAESRSVVRRRAPRAALAIEAALARRMISARTGSSISRSS